MTKKELLKLLEPYSDDAIVYIEADHGQTPGQACEVYVSKNEALPFFDFDGVMDWNDPESVKNKSHVTAINIENR